MLLTFDAARANIKWWTEALDTLAECREEEPLKYNAVIRSIAAVVPLAEESDLWALLNADLTLAEKCFVLATLDGFMDVWICSTDCSLGRWLENWEAASEFLIPAGLVIRDDPIHLPVERIEAAWISLVAAAS